MKYLIWDFDGTLGYRDKGMWSGTLLEILRQYKPEIDASIEQIRPSLQAGFPWNNPHQPHTEIKTGDQWWDAFDPLFEQAFVAVGVHADEAGSLAKQVRHLYTTLTFWRLFDDVLPTMEQLSAAGWTHLVLSNHVPELRQIMRFLQLDGHILQLFNSAETGYEKPHPQAFKTLLATLDDVETIWMIGDNFEADVLGAEAAGLPAILVRKFHPEARYYCSALDQIPYLLNRI
jgi:putative hydrolase of the HAD superfamily